MTQEDNLNCPIRVAAPRVSSGMPKFNTNDPFHRELQQRVERYFATTGRRKRDCPQMYLKSAVVFGTCVASYLLLVFFANAWWQTLPLTVLLGLSMAAVGFNIQHDGSHRAYSRHAWINRLTAMTLDLLGASSYVWARKHNSIHHTYTNIADHDDDLNVGLFGRLSPHQRRLGFHRLQHFYLWFLYGLLPIKWHVYDDFHNVLVGRIGTHSFPRPRGWDLAVFVGGKAVFFSLAFVIPSLFHPIWLVLTIYGAASLVEGVVLSVVFQLAHCVEDAGFPLPPPDTTRMETSWAVHQIETTVDFAPRNWLLSWFIGGLNFQVEHHLFPHICHLHYPAIARIVEETCKDFGLKYRVHGAFVAAVVSHFRWLRRMGMPTASPGLPGIGLARPVIGT